MASIAVTAPSSGGTVAGGAVSLRAKITGGTTISNVRFEIGAAQYGTVAAKRISAGVYGYTWDSRKSFVDGSTRPVDGCYWITAKATVDGKALVARYVRVVTRNKPITGLRTGGWRADLAWAADYSGTLTQWKKTHSGTVGTAHASLQTDPIKSGRRAIRASVPDSAVNDADQPTSNTVRFQSAAKRNIIEGDEFCVGFAVLPPADFPTTYGYGDPTNPTGLQTGWINIFQFFGPPYDATPSLILQANRRTADDPLDEFFLARNDLNEGEPLPLFSFPYNRGKWTDIVMRIKASRSIERGWIEFYVNQGAHTSVQPVSYINGLTRIPRVTLTAKSEAFRTDMQIYRVVKRLATVSLWHTGHKVARTVAEADPRSYA